jgi:hypothetical protein
MCVRTMLYRTVHGYRQCVSSNRMLYAHNTLYICRHRSGLYTDYNMRCRLNPIVLAIASFAAYEPDDTTAVIADMHILSDTGITVYIL